MCNNGLKNLPLKHEENKNTLQGKENEGAQAPKSPTAAGAAAEDNSLPCTVIQAELRILPGPPSTYCNDFFTKTLSQASTKKSYLSYARIRTRKWKQLSENGEFLVLLNASSCALINPAPSAPSSLYYSPLFVTLSFFTLQEKFLLS